MAEEPDPPGDGAREHVNGAWICRRNISNFRALLAQEPDGSRRGLLTRLLAEEEAKLRQWFYDDEDD